MSRSGSSSPSEPPARRASASASARDRETSAVRRVAWLTTMLTSAATARKMTNASRFSPWAIVNV